ncbi:MAG TPA: hypothetical protein VH912_15300 [Streptosporangiaceae bacterium]|jgi:hypothetical protein
MGMFFEVIIVGVAIWWLGRLAFRYWKARQADRAAATGAHDAGVWVNEVRWAEIVAGLENDLKPGEQGGKPRHGRPE